MYSYSWDAETGGLLLNSTPLNFSKEPRPVYYKELDLLGFDQYWNYEKNDAYPYMWAEANNYYYRGRNVAKTKGGALYTAPELVILEEPESSGTPLRFVDIPAMVEKNRSILESLVQDTIKKIYNTYVDYQNKVDIFYVALVKDKTKIKAKEDEVLNYRWFSENEILNENFDTFIEKKKMAIDALHFVEDYKW